METPLLWGFGRDPFGALDIDAKSGLKSLLLGSSQLKGLRQRGLPSLLSMRVKEAKECGDGEG